ncbi:hypothetical protein [Marinicellulosiphila megalodicopiae]|uniref:hypothetical protein n=1 Tax=Marinicellulosiphila megalodicopiae TaxID=2724896 RepID=UPI003BAFE43B
MKMINTKHRLVILNKHIQKWLDLPGINQSLVAQSIVEEFKRTNLDSELQIEDIFFMNTGDVFADVNTNRQKIFRWLGVMDNGAKRSPARLFFVEQGIVGAMPEDIRISYLNEVYKDSTACFSTANVNKGDSKLNRFAITESMIKESTEAQLAVLQLGDNPTNQQLHKAEIELREDIATKLEALELLMQSNPAAFSKNDLSTLVG